jgi:hypothetical protein
MTLILLGCLGVRGSIVGSGTTLQAGRSRDRIPDEVDFFNLPNPSSRTMALGSTEMSTRNIPGGKGRPARRADNLTAICEPIVYKMWEPQHLTTLWVSTARYRIPLPLLLGCLNLSSRNLVCHASWGHLNGLFRKFPSPIIPTLYPLKLWSKSLVILLERLYQSSWILVHIYTHTPHEAISGRTS